MDDAMLIRRREVMKMLGVTSRQVTVMVDAGVLERLQIGDAQKGYYRRRDVEKLGKGKAKA